MYSIAVLFFVSKGIYPIYDRFADTALRCIFSEEPKYPFVGDSKKLGSFNIQSYYLNEYQDKINILLKELNISKVNFIEYRDLDRALWVYGHGFKQFK